MALKICPKGCKGLPETEGTVVGVAGISGRLCVELLTVLAFDPDAGRSTSLRSSFIAAAADGLGGSMNTPKGGCEICALSARADRRGDALAPIACRPGPELLKRCTACGGHWLETLRYEKWLDAREAANLFGEPLVDGWRSARLVEAITLWDRWGRNQTLYLTEPWSAEAQLIIVTGLFDDTAPVVCDGASFSYFIEAAIAREFLEDYIASKPIAPEARGLADRLVRYAADDAWRLLL